MLCQVQKNETLSPHYHLLTLSLAHPFQTATPGQFIMVKCGISHDPLLRRPFAIHRLINDRTIEILFRIVGKGTHFLANVTCGDSLNIIGPLGNGFTIYPNSLPILIGTGAGVAPLLFLKDVILKEIHAGHSELMPKILIAGKSKSDILRESDFSKGVCHVETFVYESFGTLTSYMTEFIESALAAQSPAQQRRYLPCTTPLPLHKPILYACGSSKMLGFLAKLAHRRHLETQVCMESHMACGFGACLGCAIKTKYGETYTMKRVCTEGPVFVADNLIWE